MWIPTTRRFFQGPSKIDLNAIPSEEREAVTEIQRIFLDALSYINQFEDALTLFDGLANSPNAIEHPIGWQMIAARDGAISLCHIGYLHELLRSSFKDCPTLRATSDFRAVREAGKDYRRRFPLYEKMRHSVAHAAELFSTPEGRSWNALNDALDGPLSIGAGGAFQNVLMGRSFQQTIDGKVVSYDLSRESFDAILDIFKRTREAIRTSPAEGAARPAKDQTDRQ